jgi:hypothetical protein
MKKSLQATLPTTPTKYRKKSFLNLSTPIPKSKRRKPHKRTNVQYAELRDKTPLSGLY